MGNVAGVLFPKGMANGTRFTNALLIGRTWIFLKKFFLRQVQKKALTAIGTSRGGKTSICKAKQ